MSRLSPSTSRSLDRSSIKKENLIGEGTYGQVYNYNENSVIKINIVHNVCGYLNSIKELDCMVRFIGDPHIVQIEEVVLDEFDIGDSKYKSDTIHYVMKKAKCDLLTYMSRPHSNKRKIKIVRDLMLGLASIHRIGMAHRDLKPENILIYKSGAAITDFGFASIFTQQEYQDEGIGTRDFKAPELLWDDPHHGQPADIWALGQIILELMSGNILAKMKKKESYTSFLFRLLEQLPRKLSDEEQSRIISLPAKSYRRDYVLRMADYTYRGTKFESIISQKWFPGSHRQFVSMLESMFEPFPEDRPTIYELLAHPYWGADPIVVSLAPRFTHTLSLTNKKLRGSIAKEVRLIHSKRKKLDWYSTRTLFQSIDLYLRYLESNPDLTDQTAISHFYACVNLSHKLFTDFGDFYPLNMIAPKHVDLKEVEDFEYGFLVTFLEYWVYRDTIFEYSKEIGFILSVNDIRMYLDLYLDGEDGDYTFEKLGKMLKKESRKGRNDVIKNPSSKIFNAEEKKSN